MFTDPSLGRLVRLIEVAVPGWIEHLSSQRWAEITGRIPQLLVVLHAYSADRILRKFGSTPDDLAILAEAIAVCAFAPHGITVFGLHFRAVHPEVAERQSEDSLHE